MDDPRHGEIRRIVAKAFTPRVLEKLVGSVQAVADDVVARARRTAEDGDASIDVVADLAAPIPLRVVCDMIGHFALRPGAGAAEVHRRPVRR
jgi:cytochrome P450